MACRRPCVRSSLTPSRLITAGPAPARTLARTAAAEASSSRITLQAANYGDAAKFTQAMLIPLKHFAVFECNNQVTIGYATPANTTSDSAAGYNRVAANDILAHWTPACLAVQL